MEDDAMQLIKRTSGNLFAARKLYIAAPALLFGFYANPAAAYLGPGAGLGMVGSLIAVVIVGLVMVLGLIIYPIRLFKKRKSQAKVNDQTPDSGV